MHVSVHSFTRPCEKTRCSLSIRPMRSVLWIGLSSLALAGCSDDGSSSETGGSSGSSGSGGSSAGSSGSGGSSTGSGGSSGSSGSSASGGSAGQSNPNQCVLQGEFKAATQADISERMCNAIDFSTIYNLTIEGTQITIAQYVENFPMTGTIDAACEVAIEVTTPLYRAFDLTLDPVAMTGTGTLTEGNLSDCRATYDVEMTLEPGRAP